MSSHLQRERSARALRGCIDTLSESGGPIYLWTFTLPIALPVRGRGLTAVQRAEGWRYQPTAIGRWRVLLHRLREIWPTLRGVRIYEMHDTHGLHVHAIFDTRLPVRMVRTISTACGWGRVHVTRVLRNPYYVAKYLTKARETALAGLRVWASFGGAWASRVRDVSRVSGRSEAYGRARASSWGQRLLVVHGRSRRGWGLLAELGQIEYWGWLTGQRIEYARADWREWSVVSGDWVTRRRWGVARHPRKGMTAATLRSALTLSIGQTLI